ncbi:MAG: DnaJ family molecular chaperone [bacterium]
MKVQTSFSRGVNEERLKENLENIIMLFSDVSLIDGSISKGEVEFVREFLMNSFPGRNEIVQYLMERYRFYNENPSGINIDVAARSLKEMLNYNERVSLFSILVSLSFRSAKSERVKNRLREIGLKLDISDYEINSLLGYYQNYGSDLGASSIEDAYSVLGLRMDDSNEVVKKRYKDLVKETHPDKLRHMPENIRRKSEERFKAINEAYSKIKRDRAL